MDRASVGARGPKACVACAGSKAKCLFTPSTTASTNAKCNRCNRLNKQCVLQTAAVRIRRPKKIARVAQLEEKLQSLASQLETSQLASSGRLLNSQPSTQSPYGDCFAPEHASRGSLSSQYASSPSSHRLSQTPASCLEAPIIQAKQPIRPLDLRNPDTLLTFFRDEIADQFPFVVIPRETTAFELIHDNSFLFKSITLVASAQDVKAQVRIAEEIVEYLSLHLLLRSEKSLDLLQGLLIFIAWYHHHIHLGRRIGVLLHLAEALVTDLRLFAEPLSGLNREARAEEFWTYANEALGSEVRTVAERRAYLGFVHLSSMVSLYVYRIETPRITHYAQACITLIQKNPQYLSDHYLLQLMKLQSIAQETSEAFPRDSLELSISSTPAVVIQALRTKLTIFEDSVPIHLKTNSFLLMNYHSLLVYLTEAALHTPALPSRQATLHACLTSIISFFSALFAIPVVQYYKFCYLSWVQVLHCLSVFYKLSLFSSDDWDLSHVAGMMDLSVVLDGMLSRFGEVVALRKDLTRSSHNADSEQDDDQGLIAKFIPKLRMHKVAFEERRQEILQRKLVVSSQLPTISVIDGAPSHMRISPLPSELTDGALMQLNQFDLPSVEFSNLDDAFWREFLRDYDVS